MVGRWTIRADGPDGRVDHFYADMSLESMPVVPCDDAAIERAADEVERLMTDKTVWNVREAAERVLRAAGETP